jgi:hypothetical protein
LVDLNEAGGKAFVQEMEKEHNIKYVRCFLLSEEKTVSPFSNEPTLIYMKIG